MSTKHGIRSALCECVASHTRGQHTRAHADTIMCNAARPSHARVRLPCPAMRCTLGMARP
eukprot:366343-Chlamydomonas_euryale.AAC.11